MFNKIVIANRGEIACRVIKTARRLGIRTVAVYSEADRQALHVAMADEAVHIGPSPSRQSYLVGEKIISAARKTGAEAVHPGYGFLSENADFARQCQREGLVFIGPPASAIEAMGSKSAAKTLMAAADVPLVPGYHGDNQSPARLQQSADETGYPVLLKAVAGGGGKGMRQVWSAEEFEAALAAAKREALSSFGNDAMLLEKYLTRPRHVEVQVFCDQQGNGVYLFERDCSIQRRHQKVIEEAPAPNMPPGLREQMGATAVRAAQAINYAGAGTVEFLLDEDGSFYFMEMNTRLQVEHPVTEYITGQDLVEWQLRVAAGQPLPLTQNQLAINGHAFEARIYAEDPANNFLPVTGKLHFLQAPQESNYVRVDTGVTQGDEVSIYYDPMLAKLIVWDENRNRALARLTRALSEYYVRGVTTNIPFLYNLSRCEPFQQAELDTGFIEKHHALIFRPPATPAPSLIPMACLYLLLNREQPRHSNSPWHETNGWRLNAAPLQQMELLADGETHSLQVEQQKTGHFVIHWNNHPFQAEGKLQGNELHAAINGLHTRAVIAGSENSYCLFAENSSLEFELARPQCNTAGEADEQTGFIAPMNGTIVNVMVKPGQAVKAGDTVLLMEAMKMEYAIRAERDGIVTDVYYQPGDLVDGGASLLAFEADS